MIQSDIQEVAGVFRGEWGRVFDPYPAYSPDLSWPSVGVLDALCGEMYGRSDWTDAEATFFAGAVAHLSELIYECWRRFARGVRVEYTGSVVCAALRDDGSVYQLELERELIRRVQHADLESGVNGRLPPGAAGYRHPVERFILAACLGIGPVSGGARRETGPGGPVHHIDVVLGFMSETCADHYARRFPNEPLGRDVGLYSRNLIRPPASNPQAILEAAEGLLAYLDERKLGFREAIRLLGNLARFPSAGVREAALTCLVMDERVPLLGELIEVASDAFLHQAALYRAAAISLARRRGRNIDWLNEGENAEARFEFELRVGLLPLVSLPYRMCIDPQHREAAEALVDVQPRLALDLLDRHLEHSGFVPELTFQQATLNLSLGDPESAEQLLSRIASACPDRLDGHFHYYSGLCALELGRLEDAIQRLERARVLLPGDDRALTALGEVYLEADRPDNAVVLLNLAAARGERRAAALVSRAELQSVTGSEEGYHLDLIAAAWLNPFNPRVIEKAMANYLAE